MRAGYSWSCLLVSLGLMFGCGEGPAPYEPVESVAQPLTDGTLFFSLGDFESATLTLGAAAAGATVRVELLPSAVVIENGQPRSYPAPLVTLPSLVIAADGAATVQIDAASFPKGVGGVRLTKTDPILAGIDVKTGAKQSTLDRHSLSPTTTGTQFRVPFVGASNRSAPVSLSVSAVGGERLVRIRDLHAAGLDDTIVVPVDHTLRWTGSLTGSGTLLVVADGLIAVSGVLTGAESIKPPSIRTFPTPL
jgi:hypothetical protein